MPTTSEIFDNRLERLKKFSVEEIQRQELYKRIDESIKRNEQKLEIEMLTRLRGYELEMLNNQNFKTK